MINGLVHQHCSTSLFSHQITYEELQAFAERRGVAIQTNFEGYGRKEIKSFRQFLGALTDTLLVNVKRIFTTVSFSSCKVVRCLDYFRFAIS